MNAIDTQIGSVPEQSLPKDEAIKQLRVLFHDVRSPLTSILLWAQSLQIEAEFDNEPGLADQSSESGDQSKASERATGLNRMNEGALAIERNALIQEKCIKDLETLIYKLVSR